LGGFGLEPTTLAMQEAEGYFPGRRFQRVAERLSTQMGAPFLVGSPCFIGLRPSGDTWAWDRHYNSAYLVTEGPPPYARYDKLFLAPFGETMPYIRAWPELQARVLEIGARGMRFDLDAGDRPVVFEVPWRRPDGTTQTVRTAVPICFEDAMSWVCRELVFPASPTGRVRRADLLINITNDGWFGWFDGGRAQHVQLSRFRCVETRTPMVRVANTGMCVGIDSSGRIVAESPAPRTATWLYANPPLDEREPLFARLGDGVSWLLMALCAAMSLLSFIRPARTALTLGNTAGLWLTVAACAGTVLVGAGGCSSPKQPEQAQPWSSREQSTTPTGQARMSDGVLVPAQSIPVASSGAARDTAAALLREASHNPVPVFRANAIEALGAAPESLRQVAAGALADPNRGVRFVAAMSVGRAGLAEFASSVQPLLVDESASVRAAAIYALTKFGQRVDQTPLAAMALSDDPEVRSNAYMVLGELGNPTALPLIKKSLGKGMRIVNPARVRVIELQAAEAMVRLGDQNQIEPIRAALFAPSDQNELTALAAQIAGRLKDGGCRPMLIRLIDATGESSRPAEIRLTAAASLAELGPQDSGQIARLANAYIRDRDPIVRGQAALALARAQGPQAVPELEKMLFDADPMVQLASAKAVLIATRPR
ncbi:MAG: HEAT repeat domain-containing protein, partial [Phycisphaerae bacterium]|nr:HEAT repeat domain-containing protein [Phycisphaerae bacterium]